MFLTSNRNKNNFSSPLPPNIVWDINEITENKQQEEEKEPLKPHEIKKRLDEYVIGQEEAKLILSVAAYNHYKRIGLKDDENDIEIQKSNVLLIGKSGTGKTLLVETLAKILDVPFIAVDATDFTPTGIVGKSVDDIIKELTNKANGNPNKASKGIVFIDEFDKIASGSNSLINSNKIGTLASDTQSCFLKLLEGKELSVMSRGLFGDDTSTFNTKNILFICGGAFSGIEKILENKTISKSRQIGFYNEETVVQYEQPNPKIEAKDIINYGLMPEIVGRLPIIATLNPLSKNDIKRILTEPKNSIVKQYQKLFELDGVILEFEDKALDAVADIAYNSEVGARGLRTIIEGVMTQATYDINIDDSIWKCIITADSILNKSKPKMLYSTGEE